MSPLFFTGTAGTIIILFLAVTAILWFMLPFAVFGIKNRLDMALTQAAEANRRLSAIEQAIRSPGEKIEEPQKTETVYDC